jgi:hypothetical protein
LSSSSSRRLRVFFFVFLFRRYWNITDERPYFTYVANTCPHGNEGGGHCVEDDDKIYDYKLRLKVRGAWGGARRGVRRGGGKTGGTRGGVTGDECAQ